MKKSRFSEEQIAYALRLADSVTPVVDDAGRSACLKPGTTHGRRSMRTSA